MNWRIAPANDNRSPWRFPATLLVAFMAIGSVAAFLLIR
jgi:hypothetical protein